MIYRKRYIQFLKCLIILDRKPKLKKQKAVKPIKHSKDSKKNANGNTKYI